MRVEPARQQAPLEVSINVSIIVDLLTESHVPAPSFVLGAWPRTPTPSPDESVEPSRLNE